MQTSEEHTDRIPLDKQRYLMIHLQLVVQLGGRVRQEVSDHIPQTIAAVCQEERISLLCMGQPSLSWPRLLMQGGSYRQLLLALKAMRIDLVILS